MRVQYQRTDLKSDLLPAFANHPEETRAPGRAWAWLVYALIFILLLGHIQFHAIAPRVLAVAMKRHKIRLLAYAAVL